MPNLSRRHVLKWGGTAAATIAVSGVVLPNFGISAALGADLGEGDIGVLNYAYALEQLEAAFYSKVVESPYSGITDDETSWLTDIRDHEVEHRDFLKKALGDKAIPDLEVDFSAVDFTEPRGCADHRADFEDLGVGAYNGAGKLIENVDYLQRPAPSFRSKRAMPRRSATCSTPTACPLRATTSSTRTGSMLPTSRPTSSARPIPSS